jgi:hypothetical protein
VDPALRGDVVQADNLSTGEPLPSIAPIRFGAAGILTQSVPGRAPLPGRSLRTGLQLTF